MANSYDLTKNDRGLDLSGRLVNIDLVIIRNRTYGALQEAIRNSAPYSTIDSLDATYSLAQQLLES